MPHVTVTVNGRNYKMGCREGEERRVHELAAEVDALVQRIKGGVKLVPDDRLLLMAALMLADQLWDAREELHRALKQMAEFRSYQVIDGGVHAVPRDASRMAEQAVSKIEVLSQRLAGGS